MKQMALLALTVLSIFIFASCKTKDEWKGRAIYQLLTDRFARSDSSNESNCNLSEYCGGTYQGLMNKLDYIKGMGFNAIWISPVIENTEGSYHGYHLTNLYNTNYHFGDANSLKALVQKCHEKDIWVMVDVVANHVGPVGNDYGRITPFNSPDHYHDNCQITDWNNQWMVENCRLADLPDLKQETKWVADQLYDWIKNLVNDYGFDGIRIDTIPEVPKWFWDKFTASSGVFQIGEVFNGNPGYVADYQNHMDSVFNYPLYYTIKDSFCGSMKNLENYMFNTRKAFKNPSVLGVFVENHDNPRFLHMCGDQKKFKNAVAFSLTFEGIPVFYYGGEQFYAGGADPNNREPLWGNYNTGSEMYTMIGKINYLRNTKHFYNTETVQRYADDDFYAFTRGDVLVCLTRGTGASRDLNYHGFSDGSQLCNILADNDCVTVNGGKIYIQIGQDPKIYVKQ